MHTNSIFSGNPLLQSHNVDILLNGLKCESGLPTRVDEEDKCLIFKYIFDPHWAKNTIINYFYYGNDQYAFYFTFL